jgi:hypothetical protein
MAPVVLLFVAALVSSIPRLCDMAVPERLTDQQFWK